ncbi:embryonic polyadenylate-binding protein B-like [Camellia sinensis]|uniref:embryonic polyadenylate-binding protein B-like n=1 Tax=Camellia sinensis TaxID=4442 RepID=UPI001035B76F|nr:embryonic polyadenylate-binding protein B-like [Camellia sinensis]
MEQRGVKLGGWRTVFRRRHIGGRSNSTGEVHNVFVDNLPDSMHPKGLYDLFTNFGVVIDVYIPSKRRHSTGTRFGFVRYDCPVVAEMAIQKAHDTWCDGRALKVKQTDFKKKNISKVKPQADVHHLPPVETGKRWMRVEEISTKGKSYAKVVMGGKVTNGKSISVNAVEYGNGWLYGSVIEKL